MIGCQVIIVVICCVFAITFFAHIIGADHHRTAPALTMGRGKGSGNHIRRPAGEFEENGSDFSGVAHGTDRHPRQRQRN